MAQQVKPKKALGQHFLTDLDIAWRIAATLDDYKGLPVMEVGPGMGVLTQYLIAGGHDVKVAEIDGGTVECCSGMLQREVAERLAAPAGTKTRGILSVLLQAWYDVEYLFTVEPGVFNPPPKVQSGVIRMRRNSITDLGCDERLFKTVVKTAFSQRRKTLRNSLRGLLPSAQTPDCLPLGQMRPEQLTVADFVELTNFIASLRPARQ